MIPSPRRTALRRRLLAWYDAGHRPLPWRFPQHAADPYRVWVAEVMLQQTQVRTAIPFYERFLARFPTLEALASAPEEDVLAAWSGLGYYARARNLRAAAREALRAHGGLPSSVAALRALPGFGPYTAGAVASIAFAVPAAAVDGNVARVLARLFLVAGDPARAPARSRIAALAAELVGERPSGRRRGQPGTLPRDLARPGDLNQALMELGATLCGKPVPRCERCPVARACAARAARREREVPRARTRPARRPLLLACAVVRRDDAVLLARRPRGGLFGGLLALPLAEVAPGDDPRLSLARTLEGEHGLAVRPGAELAACERTLTHRLLTLRAFACEMPRARPPPPGLRFTSRRELEASAMPSAMRELLRRCDASGGIAAAGDGFVLRADEAAGSGRAPPPRGRRW